MFRDKDEIDVEEQNWLFNHFSTFSDTVIVSMLFPSQYFKIVCWKMHTLCLTIYKPVWIFNDLIGFLLEFLNQSSYWELVPLDQSHLYILEIVQLIVSLQEICITLENVIYTD